MRACHCILATTNPKACEGCSNNDPDYGIILDGPDITRVRRKSEGSLPGVDFETIRMQLYAERAKSAKILSALKEARTLITLSKYKTWIKNRQDEVDGWPRDYQRAIAYQAGWNAAIDAVIKEVEG